MFYYHGNSVVCLAFHPNQNLVAFADREGTIKILAFPPEKLLSSFPCHALEMSWKVSGSHNYLLTLHNDRIACWLINEKFTAQLVWGSYPAAFGISTTVAFIVDDEKKSADAPAPVSSPVPSTSTIMLALDAAQLVAQAVEDQKDEKQNPVQEFLLSCYEFVHGDKGLVAQMTVAPEVRQKNKNGFDERFNRLAEQAPDLAAETKPIFANWIDGENVKTLLENLTKSKLLKKPEQWDYDENTQRLAIRFTTKELVDAIASYQKKIFLSEVPFVPRVAVFTAGPKMSVELS